MFCQGATEGLWWWALLCAQGAVVVAVLVWRRSQGAGQGAGFVAGLGAVCVRNGGGFCCSQVVGQGALLGLSSSMILSNCQSHLGAIRRLPLLIKGNLNGTSVGVAATN